MTRRYFGTDGIRGTVGQAPITPDFVLRLAHAVGRVLKQAEAHPTVLIGKDTRISGYMLESALQAGLCAAGVNVRLTGPMPTPAVAYLTRALRAQAGIVISASHNPFEDNGIKFFSSLGTKLPDDIDLTLIGMGGGIPYDPVTQMKMYMDQHGNRWTYYRSAKEKPWTKFLNSQKETQCLTSLPSERSLKQRPIS